MASSESFYVIGLDGGGTKVEAVLLDGTGTVHSSGYGGPSNTTFVDNETALQSVRTAFSTALSDTSLTERISAVGCCSMIRYLVKQVLDEAGFAGQLFSYGEGIIAFRRAGLLSRRGIAVIAGTGSSFVAYDGGERVKSLGGWGMTVGDEGSGFDIGLHALKAAGRSVDGRGPGTMLLDFILQHINAVTFAEVLGMYCYPYPSQHKIAGLSKVVGIAAGEGDEVAREILQYAGASLGNDTVHLARQVFRVDEEFDVALSGGVFNAGDLVVKPLTEQVLAAFSQARIHVSVMGPGEAVAKLALEELSS